MVEAYREVLIVFDAKSQERSLEIVRGLTKVTQVLPPRFALAHIMPQQRVQLTQIEGVVGVYDDSGPSMDGLSPIEQGFVKAWHSRSVAKQRAGNNADWDAPGFLPPDKNGSGGEMDQ